MSFYGVELLFERRPKLDVPRILASMRKSCPLAKAPSASEELIAFFHEDHWAQFTDGAVPVQTAIMPTDKSPDPERIEAAVQQSWSWPDARSVASRCEHVVLVNEMFGAMLDRKPRLHLFQTALAAIIEALPCDAIHWVSSGQVISPKSFVDGIAEHGAGDPLTGAVNVRLFNIGGYGSQHTPGSTGDMLMDSLGLEPFGLPDVQCHFRQVEATTMARVLFNTAAYLFHQGDVVEDGQTIPGLTQDQKWRCQHEASLVDPNREVLDINPGPGFAAGNRGDSFQ